MPIAPNSPGVLWADGGGCTARAHHLYRWVDGRWAPEDLLVKEIEHEQSVWIYPEQGWLEDEAYRVGVSCAWQQPQLELWTEVWVRGPEVDPQLVEEWKRTGILRPVHPRVCGSAYSMARLRDEAATETWRQRLSFADGWLLLGAAVLAGLCAISLGHRVSGY